MSDRQSKSSAFKASCLPRKLSPSRRHRGTETFRKAEELTDAYAVTTVGDELNELASGTLAIDELMTGVCTPGVAA